MYSALKLAALDILKSLRGHTLIGVLGFQDIKQRYRRSALGPFWLTISMGVNIATIGIVFGQLFGSPMRDFLPFLTIGLVLWAYIASCVNEGCTAFIDAQGIIKQLPIPLSTHIFRVVWRNFIILLHNILIFPFVIIVFGKSITWSIIYGAIGIFLLILAMSWVALLLAIFCARYRDLPQIIGSVLQILFYVTPIIWMPSLLGDGKRVFYLETNPLYHLLQVVRAPMLGEPTTPMNWAVSIGIVVFGWCLTLLVYGKFKNRIAYWI